jgi:hypothetical protein
MEFACSYALSPDVLWQTTSWLLTIVFILSPADCIKIVPFVKSHNPAYTCESFANILITMADGVRARSLSHPQPCLSATIALPYPTPPQHSIGADLHMFSLPDRIYAQCDMAGRTSNTSSSKPRI